MPSQLATYDVRESQERTGIPERVGGDEATIEDFMRITEEIRTQPYWREEADKAADYYDNNQLEPEFLNLMERRGIPPIVSNMIQPTIDVVLGLEAKMRLDWRVNADTDEQQDLAEALSQRLYEAERETGADYSCADAYASQVKTGMGWVEVNRNIDPLRYLYKTQDIHRREMYWDWTSRERDLSDASYVVRRKWYDIDMLAKFFPKHKDLIIATGYGWPMEYVQLAREDTRLAYSLDNTLRFSLEEYEWRDLGRGRIAVYELIRRRWVNGHILRMPTGDTVELDMRNPLHVEAVGRGIVRPQPAIYTRLSGSLWAGPNKLAEYPVKRIPYIPFWGYREDLTGIPYGLIRSMFSPQDKINARESKLQWQISAKRVIMDADALDQKSNTVSEVVEEIARPDAVIILNPSRRNANAIDVNDSLGVSQQQFEVLQSAKDDLQKVRGIFNAMLGRTDAADSGVAINNLVEQGMTVLAKIYSNYLFARRNVGEALLDLIRDDLVGRRVEVVAGTGQRKRVIVLNNPVQDEQTGEQVLQNDVSSNKVKVALEDVPSTPSYRAQQLQLMSEVIRNLPPEAQMALTPSFIELTELSDRKQVADLLRGQFGLNEPKDPENMTPEEQSEIAQKEEMANAQTEMSMRMLAAQLAEQEAKVEKLKAETSVIGVVEPREPKEPKESNAMDPRMLNLQLQEQAEKVNKLRIENERLAKASIEGENSEAESLMQEWKFKEQEEKVNKLRIDNERAMLELICVLEDKGGARASSEGKTEDKSNARA